MQIKFHYHIRNYNGLSGSKYNKGIKMDVFSLLFKSSVGMLGFILMSILTLNAYLFWLSRKRAGKESQL